MEHCIVVLESVLYRMLCSLDMGMMYVFPRFIPVIYIVSTISRIWLTVENRCFLISGRVIDGMILTADLASFLFALQGFL